MVLYTNHTTKQKRAATIHICEPSNSHYIISTIIIVYPNKGKQSIIQYGHIWCSPTSTLNYYWNWHKTKLLSTSCTYHFNPPPGHLLSCRPITTTIFNHPTSATIIHLTQAVIRHQSNRIIVHITGLANALHLFPFCPQFTKTSDKSLLCCFFNSRDNHRSAKQHGHRTTTPHQTVSQQEPPPVPQSDSSRSSTSSSIEDDRYLHLQPRKKSKKSKRNKGRKET